MKRLSHLPRTRLRRGATILIVLVLISITLAFSFALLRTQNVSSQVQQNYGRRANAKQAAMAGLSIGMRKMSDPSWAGVGVDLRGKLAADTTYHVTFATGDPALTPGHPEAAEYPYRVTVTSTGTCSLPGDSNQKSTHTVRAVMQLIRRQMQPTPAAWADVQPYTLYQWNAAAGRAVELEMPSRIEGPVAIQNDIALCQEYPGGGNGEALAGTMDNVTILASELTSSEIAQLANGDVTLESILAEPNRFPIGSWHLGEPAGSEIARDEIGIHPGIYDGARPGASTDAGGGAATFDGVDDQIYLGQLGIYTGKITILTTLKIAEFREKMQIATNASSSTTLWSLGIDGPQRRLTFTVRSWFGNHKEIKSPNDALVLDEWVDIAAVYSGTKLSLYIDGVLVEQESMLGFLATSPVADASLGMNAPGNARVRYLRDLRAMRDEGQPDQRPFDGPIKFRSGMFAAATQDLLEQDLGITVGGHSLPEGAPVAHPGEVTQYQLYPGGEVYAATILSGSISDRNLGPDPRTNPLGLFLCSHELRVYDNVTIAGTLITHRDSSAGNVRIVGDNVRLEAVDLPLVAGESLPRQLPTAIINNDFEIEANSSGSLSGVAITFDDFRFKSGSAATDFRVEGKLIVNEIQLEKRTEWDENESWWNNRMSDFMRSIDTQAPANSRFPAWLAATRGLDSNARFYARPPAAARQYHWHDWSKPLFTKHPDDQGLCWDLVDWSEVP